MDLKKILDDHAAWLTDDSVSADWYPAFFEKSAFLLLFRTILLSPRRWSDDRQFAAWSQLDTLRIRRETGDLV